MCGITGYVGPTYINKNVLDFFMVSNLVRGKDSAGYFNGKSIFKAVGAVDENLLVKFPITKTKVFIGHCRAATAGYHVTLNNAHPFSFKSFVLVHNGTITNIEAMKKEVPFQYQLEDGTWDTCTVDSKYLAYRLHKDFNTANKFKVLEEYTGAAAIIFSFLDESGALRYAVYHDKERPMFIGELNNGVVFHSLEYSLNIAGATNIKEVPVETVFIYDNTGNLVSETKIDRLKKKPTTYVTYTDSTWRSGHSNIIDYTKDETETDKIANKGLKLFNDLTKPKADISTNIVSLLNNNPTMADQMLKRLETRDKLVIPILGITNTNEKIKTLYTTTKSVGASYKEKYGTIRVENAKVNIDFILNNMYFVFNTNGITDANIKDYIDSDYYKKASDVIEINLEQKFKYYEAKDCKLLPLTKNILYTRSKKDTYKIIKGGNNTLKLYIYIDDISSYVNIDKLHLIYYLSDESAAAGINVLNSIVTANLNPVKTTVSKTKLEAFTVKQTVYKTNDRIILTPSIVKGIIVQLLCENTKELLCNPETKVLNYSSVAMAEIRESKKDFSVLKSIINTYINSFVDSSNTFTHDKLTGRKKNLCLTGILSNIRTLDSPFDFNLKGDIAVDITIALPVASTNKFVESLSYHTLSVNTKFFDGTLITVMDLESYSKSAKELLFHTWITDSAFRMYLVDIMELKYNEPISEFENQIQLVAGLTLMQRITTSLVKITHSQNNPIMSKFKDDEFDLISDEDLLEGNKAKDVTESVLDNFSTQISHPSLIGITENVSNIRRIIDEAEIKDGITWETMEAIDDNLKEIEEYTNELDGAILEIMELNH
jgi:hypothetical protein